MERDNWKTKITTSPKLRTYCTFKENPHFEPYAYKTRPLLQWLSPTLESVIMEN